MNDQTNSATGLHDSLNHERSEGAISGDDPQRPHPATRKADPLVRAGSPDPALAAPRADSPAATRKADPLVRAGFPDPALAAPLADSPAEAQKADPLVRAGSGDGPGTA